MMAKAPLPLRVLVVDDCPDTTQSLAILLQLWGHEARTANDGAAALPLARVWRPHVVLLDLAMPGTNGLQVGASLRKLPGLEKVCLVAMSGYAGDEQRQQALNAGFDYFLVKPFDLQELERLLVDFAQKCQD
jgi:CheY-like chemotaxis protein